jgi:hypothetical protein
MSIRKGDGSGNFTGNTEIPVGFNPYFVAVGNFNGDNHPDLATANYFGNSVSIRFGNGYGGFTGNVEESAGSYPMCVAVGEFNNDSIDDIAVSNFYDYSVSILLGFKGSPPVFPIANNSPLCKGASIHLGATRGVSFSWSGPNGFFSSSQNVSIPSCTLNDSGIYYVIITDSSACSVTASTNVVIHPLPVVSFTLPQDTLCADNPTQLLSGGSPSNGHYSGTGVAANQFFPHVSGPGNFLLTYTYTDSNSCTNSATDKMHIVICTGVEDLQSTNSFNVYPNPVSEEFNIDVSLSVAKYTVSLYSQVGMLVKKWIVSGSGKQNFSTEGITSGVYLLDINSDDNRNIFRSLLNVEH